MNIVNCDESKQPIDTAEQSTSYPKTGTGTALIFCNSNFDSDKIPNRSSAAKDVEDLKDVLPGLGFKVIPYFDKTADEMKDIVKNVSSNEFYHRESDCFLCIISSHGKWKMDKDDLTNEQELTDAFMGVDGKLVRLAEFVKPFQKTSSLLDKPKIFLLQFCRGSYYTKNVAITQATKDGRVVDAKLETFVGSNVECIKNPAHPENFQIPYNIPIKKDVLLHYATTPGELSFKYGSGGTPFLQAWHKVLTEHAHTTDVLSMTTVVNDKVSEYHSDNQYNPLQGGHNRKQMSQVVSMLTKDFFFSSDKLIGTKFDKLSLKI